MSQTMAATMLRPPAATMAPAACASSSPDSPRPRRNSPSTSSMTSRSSERTASRSSHLSGAAGSPAPATAATARPAVAASTGPPSAGLLLWLLCVGVSGGMFVLLLLGLLDRSFPAAADRNRWIEINTQVLNALFTLMSLYQHPALCHHLFLLCRWRHADAAELRAVYCKDGPAAEALPGDRKHLAVEEDDVSVLEAKSNREMLEDADRSMLLSDGSWRVEKVKKLINMVTLVSLLILLYTRGIVL